MTEVSTKMMKENKIGRSQSMGKTIRKAKITLGDRYNQMTRPELGLFIIKLAFQRKLKSGFCRVIKYFTLNALDRLIEGNGKLRLLVFLRPGFILIEMSK